MEEKTIFDQAKKDLEKVGVPSATDAALAIFKAYAEPDRHYHGIEHIKRMLETARSLDLPDEQALGLRLLILYHDVWYRVGQVVSKNELESTKWALKDIDKSYLCDTAWVKRLRRLLEQGIMATITHTLTEVDEEFHGVVSLLLDIDLLGLSQPRHRFIADTEMIWYEYKEYLNGDRRIFDRGRSAWARLLLGRDKIFHHPLFLSGDSLARSNLESLVNN